MRKTLIAAMLSTALTTPAAMGATTLTGSVGLVDDGTLVGMGFYGYANELIQWRFIPTEADTVAYCIAVDYWADEIVWGGYSFEEPIFYLPSTRFFAYFCEHAPELDSVPGHVTIAAVSHGFVELSLEQMSSPTLTPEEQALKPELEDRAFQSFLNYKQEQEAVKQQLDE